MSADEIIQDILKSAGLLTAIGALIGIWVSRRNGVKGDERAARAQEQEAQRDTVADRDALIDQYQEDRKEIYGRLAAVEQANETYRQELSLEKEYSRLLLDWGYRGGPPPPPARPRLS